MNEEQPKHDEEFVPSAIFSQPWLEGNFVIPADKLLRTELRQKLETCSRYGVMFLEENQKVRDVLLARIAALDAYDEEMAKQKRDTDIA